MKKIYLILTALLCTMTLSAQEVKTGFETIELQYNPSFIRDNGKNFFTWSASAELDYAVPMKKGSHTFLQFGVGLQDNYYKRTTAMVYNGNNYGNMLQDANIVSFYIPLNIMHEYKTKGKVSWMPYTGLKLRCCFFESSDLYYDSEKNFNGSVEEHFRSQALFHRGESDWNSFVLAWHAGVNLKCSKHTYVGASYGFDLTEMCDGTRQHNGAVKIGYIF